MGKIHLPILLADRLYVPESKVTQEHLDAFTHVIERTTYVKEQGLTKRCGTCTWWMKPWRDDDGNKAFCHLQGYGEYDKCGDYEARGLKQVEEEEIHTYKRLRDEGYVAFARGDYEKLKRTFGERILDKAEDQRSQKRMGIPLEFGGPEGKKLYPEQKVLVKQWLKAGGGFLRSPTGCHRKGTLVRLFDGSTKAVEDVRRGDLLMGPDSQPRKVTRLYRGYDRMMKITPVKGDPWYGNGEHVLTLVHTSTGEVVDVPISVWETWSKNQKHLHKLFRVGVEYPTNQDEPVDPYFLGVLLGDGSIIHGVNVTNPEPEIRELMFKQARKWKLKVRVSQLGRSCPCYHLSTKNGGRNVNTLIQALKDIGVFGSKAGNKRVPSSYLHGDRSQRGKILAGLLDTDGHYDRCGVYDFISKSKGLAEDVTELARSLGLAAYIKPAEKYCQTGAGGTYWRVCISGDVDRIPCRVKRKQASPRRQKKDPLRTGFSITTAKKREAYFGFELEGDHRYLLADFTVTHNTGKALCASYLFCKLGLRTLVLASETRHLTTVMAEMKKSTNIDELQKEYDSPLMGIYSNEGKKRGQIFPITFATFQSLGSKYGKKELRKLRDKFGFVWIEELHRSAADKWFKTAATFNPLWRGGSSATPQRKDQMECVIFDSVGPVVAEGHAQAMTCEVTFIKSGVSVPDHALKRYGAYPWSGMLSLISNKRELLDAVTLNVISDIQKGYKPLVISERRNFAIAVHRELEALGFTSKLIMGGEKKAPKRGKEMFKDPWKPINEALGNGSLQAVIGTGVMNEAVNIPNLSALHLPHPSANPIREEQRAGRINRVVPGKPTPQIRVYTFEGASIASTGCRKTRMAVYTRLGFRFKGDRGAAEGTSLLQTTPETTSGGSRKIRSLDALPSSRASRGSHRTS